jgi:thioredoxin-dependent peroxiredoxin
MLKPGNKVPAFAIKDENGNLLSNKSISGQRVVLYFYPKDDTPGCTKEACSFRDNLPKFGKLNIPVFGISADDEKAHSKFIKKYDLNFSLLADVDHAVCDAFGTWVEKSMYGKKYFGIQRSTFLIGADGKIEKVWEKVSPEFHAREILDYLSGNPEQAGALEDAKPKKVAKTAAVKTPAEKTAVKAVVKKVTAKKTVAKKAAVKKVSVKKAAPRKK